MRQWIVLILVLTALGCSSGQPPQSLSPVADAAALPSAAKVELGDSGHFRFVADDATSLAHFLYEWALYEKKNAEKRFSAREELAKLTDGERAAWERALAHFSAVVISRELGFDQGLAELRFTFAGLIPAPAAANDQATVAEVEALLPSYRRLFWPSHLAAARRWVAAYFALPRIEEREDHLARRIAEAFAGSWPEGRTRVDLAPYGSWSGAYTVVFEGRPVSLISSLDPNYQGEAALEMVFHERTHNWDTFGAFDRALREEFERHRRTLPRGFGHAIHFFTVGELARSEAAQIGIGYTPYAEAQKLYKGEWAKFHQAMARHWAPVLAGATERQAAVAALVESLLAEQP